MINIAGLTPVNDPAYRYKMPKLVGKVEGKGNGIKTVLVNVDDLGLALKRDPAEVTKFFGCELGAQTSYATDRAIVNGAHRDDILHGHLLKYIENFVLCKNCHLPETHYKIKEGLISQKCIACGSKDPVDMRHKLCTFILASHKKAKEIAKKEGKDDKKKEKSSSKEKGDKEKSSKKEKREDSDEGNASPDKKSSKKNTKSKSSDDQQPESVFTAVEAAVASQEEEDEPESKIVDEAIERYRAYLTAATSATAADKLEELRNITTMNNLKTAYRVVIFFGAAFNADFISANAIEANAEVLKSLANGEIQQRQLLAAMEWLVAVKHPNTARLVAKAFMQLYDTDLVEEDTFMTWAGDTTVNDYTLDQSMINYDACETVRNHAAPFVKWLQEAEEEGEEDDEEGEEEDDEEEEGEEGEEDA